MLLKIEQNLKGKIDNCLSTKRFNFTVYNLFVQHRINEIYIDIQIIKIRPLYSIWLSI